MFADGRQEQAMRVCPFCETRVRTKAKFCSVCGRKLPDLQAGDRVGNYIVEGFLGVGGIGAVYLSHHRLLKQRAALKIHDYFPQDEYVARAFLRSSNYLSQLDHPNIVHLYDFDLQHGKAYQALEYINGPTFAHLRPQQTKDWIDRCIKYFTQLLNALYYSHTCPYTDVDGTLKQGIYHGDIKPHNIFLEPNSDTAKLADFMIPDVQASLQEKETDFRRLDWDTAPFGTPNYMAPEQEAGQISPQTDIYSLGITMFQLVTGYNPASPAYQRAFAMLWNGIPLQRENPYIPDWLGNLITKASRRDPSQRFQTVADMIRIFQYNQVQGTTPIVAQGGDAAYTGGQHAIGQFNNLVASLNTTSQGELAEALKLLKEAIMASTAISDLKKRELIEIINQIGEEATKVVPNTTLLKIVGDGLLATLRAIPDASFHRIVEESASIIVKLYREQAKTRKIIRVLFLAANPKDTDPLRLGEEMRGIDKALRQSEYRDRFEIMQQGAVRISDLQGHLLRYQPDIVHFSGHGSSSHEIILEDNYGNSQPVSSRALSQIFSVLRDNIRCVVLNACYSKQQAQAIAQHIDCVIGMSKAIGDNAAIGFAMAFYQALGYGRNVKTAFELGCSEIDLENLGEQNTPKLLSTNCNPATILFTDNNS
ncbi:MAG TPA: protein kinase [Ktedonobacteraceae bacterium]|nr:protein kinase [Ktedonobacteraceae bacterium]